MCQLLQRDFSVGARLQKFWKAWEDLWADTKVSRILKGLGLDLFATRFNKKLPLFVSPVPGNQVPWHAQWTSSAYHGRIWMRGRIFPPAAILGKVVMLQDHPCHSIILITPGWPNMPWFWDLMAVSSPRCLPKLPNLLTQPFNQTSHRNLSNLNLHAWLMEPRLSLVGLLCGSGDTNGGSSKRMNQISRWGKVDHFYTKWCLSNQVDFKAPPLKSIADFLLHLFQVKLQLSTINGYRSAIADKLGNSSIDVSKDENVTHLLDSVHRDRPKGQGGGGAYPPGTSPWSYTRSQRFPLNPLKRPPSSIWLSRLFSFWPWFQVHAGSMFCETRMSDIKQTGHKCRCTLPPALFQRNSWPKRVQTVCGCPSVRQYFRFRTWKLV